VGPAAGFDVSEKSHYTDSVISGPETSKRTFIALLSAKVPF
jgi:hypothetical protein